MEALTYRKTSHRGASSRGEGLRKIARRNSAKSSSLRASRYNFATEKKILGKVSKMRETHGGRSAGGAAKKLQIDVQYLAAVKEFETAVRHLRKQRFGKAKEIFEKLASSPVREVAARSAVHLLFCEHKLGSPKAAAKSAEDWYSLGVFKLNAGRYEQAIESLSKADKMAPNREHIRYALAAAHAALGNAAVAIEHLKAAILFRPQNRAQARLDPEFKTLAEDPRFRQLTNPS